MMEMLYWPKEFGIRAVGFMYVPRAEGVKRESVTQEMGRREARQKEDGRSIPGGGRERMAFTG